MRRGAAAGLLIAVLLLGGGWSLTGAGDDCEQSTPALESMDWGRVVFRSPDGDTERSLRVRLARDGNQRAAGMQRLCAEAVAANPMLFVFPRPQRPSFHMRNVHVPLDILFIREDGTVSEIHRMDPGDGLTTPSSRVRYALELPVGEAEALGLTVGDRMRFH
ncbi:MAG: DUF192 domain-containing protein [Ectothiorhodospiraceae bacterium]|nr:DUF192 domain-containing protein [Ectothiorhodospiraceae bacterium]